MNKPLRRIAIFCGLLILALLIRDNWLQYGRAEELNTHDYNRRVLIERYSHERGNIIVDGKPITGSTKSGGIDFAYKRTYTDGPMWAPVTGYASQAFGANQMENLEDGVLSGNDDRLFFDRTMGMFTGKKQKGGNVVTTLNGAAQKAAFKGLGNKKGAVAALDPQTGKILALASAPSYDPSKFAGNSDKDSKAWTSLGKKADANDPMLNRALRETYPPGSTFKVLTAAAALEHGTVTDPDAATDSPLPWHHARDHPVRCRTRTTSPARTSRSARRFGSPATPSSASWARTSARTRCWRPRRSSASTRSTSPRSGRMPRTSPTT